MNKKILASMEGKHHDRKPPYSRKDLRAMGLPSDLTEDDVKTFFSLPDDDDSMHMQRA